MVRIKEEPNGDTIVYDDGGKQIGKVRSHKSYITKPLDNRKPKYSFVANPDASKKLKQQLLDLHQSGSISPDNRKTVGQVKVLVERLPAGVVQAALADLRSVQTSSSIRSWCIIM